MSIFSRFFKRPGKVDTPQSSGDSKLMKIQLTDFFARLELLLSKDMYIARSDYRDIVSDFNDLYATIKTLDDAGVLTYYCRDNDIARNLPNDFLGQYASLCGDEVPETVREHNDSYINRTEPGVTT